jgi:hypothetical protein
MALDQIPEGLKALLAARPAMQPPNGAAAPPGFAPGSTPYPGAVPGAMQPPAAAPAAGMTPAVTPAVTAERVPRAAGMPSDDPALDPNAVSNSPEMQNLRNITSKMQDLGTQRAALKPPSAEQYKPALWKRIGTAAASVISPRAGNALHDLEWGGYNRAENDYQQKSGALDKQMAAEREQLAPAEAAAKITGENWERRYKVANLDRETQRDQSNAEYKNNIADIKQQIATNNLQGAQDKLDQAQKALEVKQKNGEDTLALRKELLEFREQLAGKAKPAQFAGAEAKKASALTKAHNEYVKATRNLSLTPDEKGEYNQLDIKANQDAHDDFMEAQQQAQDAYEAEITALGGTPAHQDVTAWNGKPAPKTPPPAAAPAAKPAAAPQAETPQFPKDFFKGKENKRVTVDVGGGRTAKFDIQPDGTPKPVAAAGTP